MRTPLDIAWPPARSLENRCHGISYSRALPRAIALLQKRETVLREEGRANTLTFDQRFLSLKFHITYPRSLVSGEIPGRINARIWQIKFFSRDIPLDLLR